MMAQVPMVTFLKGEEVTDPIPVPMWSVVSWFDELGRERSEYITSSRYIGYHGPFYVNGVKREPPETHLLGPAIYKTQMMPKIYSKPKALGVSLPRWAFWLQQAVMWLLLGLWIWEVNR